MRFLLDTNAVIAVMRGKAPILDRLRRQALRDVAVSSIVIHELRYGASKSARQAENHARIDALRFEVVPFDAEDAYHAGEIRAALARVGTPIGGYDLLIAGQTIAKDLILVTHNTREFDRVAGLRVEDWEV